VNEAADEGGARSWKRRVGVAWSVHTTVSMTLEFGFIMIELQGTDACVMSSICIIMCANDPVDAKKMQKAVGET
jgi:hypothetical protein